jgi:hypothetical protein
MKSATFDKSRVSKAITLVNYSKKQIAYGLRYAEEQSAQTDSEAYCLAISRILELDSQLAEMPSLGRQIHRQPVNPDVGLQLH